MKTVSPNAAKPFPLGLLLRVAGAGSALVVLFSIVEPKRLAEAFSRADAQLALSSLALASLSPLLTSTRLKLFLSVVGAPTPYRRCLSSALCGLSLNLVLPARGGDLAKIAHLRTNGSPSWGTLGAAALLERGFDLLALGLIGLAFSVILGLPQAAGTAGAVALTAAASLILLPKLTRLPFVGKKFAGLAVISKEIRRNKPTLLAAFGLCLLCWTTNSLVMGMLLRAFDESLSLLYALAATPPAILAGIVPISLWGIGTRDGALAYFLQGSTAPENALAAGFLYTALTYWLLGLLGIPALLAARKKTASTSLVTPDPDAATRP